MITNLPDLDSVEVLSHYHGLWQVEETFRISKHDLRDASDPSLDAGAGARTHRDFVHGADVCATFGLSSPVVQYKPLSPEVVRNALWCAQYSIVKDRRSAQLKCSA